MPLRAVSDAFSVPVQWDHKKKVVTIDNKYTLAIGSKIIRENGVAVKQMDVQPKMIQGTVYVPVRDVGFLFNTTVSWDSTQQQVEFKVGDILHKIAAYDEKIVNKPKVSTENKVVNAGGKSLTVNLVSINLLAPNTTLHVELAKNKLGSVDSLASIAKSHGAKAAINGNYFDAYTNNATRLVYNGLVMNGERIKPFDPKFSVFYYTKKGDVGILSGSAFMERFEKGDVQEAIQVGPRLLTNSQITVDPVSEGFSSTKILNSPATRSAIGILKNRQIIFVTTNNATIQQLASIMKQLGAVDAMNSDGGASSGLYANGKYLMTPGRDIAVGLLVK